MSYQEKYLKYKKKYLIYKQYGGNIEIINAEQFVELIKDYIENETYDKQKFCGMWYGKESHNEIFCITDANIEKYKLQNELLLPYKVLSGHKHYLYNGNHYIVIDNNNNLPYLLFTKLCSDILSKENIIMKHFKLLESIPHLTMLHKGKKNIQAIINYFNTLLKQHPMDSTDKYYQYMDAKLSKLEQKEEELANVEDLIGVLESLEDKFDNLKYEQDTNCEKIGKIKTILIGILKKFPNSFSVAVHTLENEYEHLVYCGRPAFYNLKTKINNILIDIRNNPIVYKYNESSRDHDIKKEIHIKEEKMLDISPEIINFYIKLVNFLLDHQSHSTFIKLLTLYYEEYIKIIKLVRKQMIQIIILLSNNELYLENFEIGLISYIFSDNNKFLSTELTQDSKYIDDKFMHTLLTNPYYLIKTVDKNKFKDSLLIILSLTNEYIELLNNFIENLSTIVIPGLTVNPFKTIITKLQKDDITDKIKEYKSLSYDKIVEKINLEIK
jgi:hypothetical protein